MRRALALSLSWTLVAACAGDGVRAGVDAAGRDAAATAATDAAAADAPRAADAARSCPGPTWSQGSAPVCNHLLGVTGPLPPCTTAWPCHFLAKTITTPYSVPAECMTSAADHPPYDDGPPRTWTDPMTGRTRAACVYVPPAAGPGHRLPLLVYLHGSDGSATDVYDSTLLRRKADSFDLSGDPTRPGFVLAAPQAGNVHWPGGPDFEGSHEDTFFRDLAAPSCNADVRNLDHLIDGLVADGAVDPKRIYITGHSNGATFAHLYAIARDATPTPGGNRVAAASTYAGYDPFNAYSDADDCALAPYPTSTVPIQQVHRDCDALVPCDEAQRLEFGLPPGDDAEQFMNATLPGLIGDPNHGDVIIDEAARRVTACTAATLCSEAQGTLNHVHWPDGINDRSGTDWEPAMLAYLRDHPLP